MSSFRSPKRLTICTVGSRGDVQPYVALGVGLANAGYAVTLATHAVFEPFVRRHGLDFATLGADPRAVIGTPESERWLQTGRARDLWPAMRRFRRELPSLLATLLTGYERVAHGSDALLFSAVAFPALWVAERLEIPAIGAWLQPLHPTGAFPPIGARRVITGRVAAPFNRAAYALAYTITWQAVRSSINQWRHTALSLPTLPRFGPVRQGSFPTLYGYSPLVEPRPADWPPGVDVTGYWVLGADPGWQPSDALAAFLADGPPPVYVGFGSLTPQHAESLTHWVLEALAHTGQRAILGKGWGQLGDGALPAHVMAVNDVPHEWLFPRMAAVVHHGGAGTTGAALRAGLPSIVVPLGFDQPYWGARVATLGVGPRPCARPRITSAWLTTAIRQCLQDPAMRDRAATLGRALHAEDGVAAAVARVQALVG